MIYSSWDIECERLKLVIMGRFLPFYPTLKTRKSQFWKNEKSCWRYHHFTHMYQNHNHMRYGSWDTESDRQKLSFWSIFCHFTYNNPKYQKFEKMKKASGDVINLHLCTKNHNHVMYASWDMECNKHNMTYGSWDMDCDRQNFWSFLAIFGPFTPLTT